MVFNKSSYGVFVLVGLCVLLSVSVHADSESGGWHISNCPDNPNIEFMACEVFAYDFEVSGPIDEPHHFAILSGPGTIHPNTGVYLLTPQEINWPQWVEIAVIDEDGRGDECSLHLMPRTEPRTIVNCPDEVLPVTAGFVVGYFFFSESNCTHAPTGYTILERDGIVGDLSISPIGELEFRPDSQDVGRHTILVAATDAYTTGPPCAIEFEVLEQAEYAVRIEVESGSNGNGALPGTEVIVDVSLDSYERAITGFDFLFSYPVSALSFIYSDTVGASAFETCGWEYFTYRMEPAGEPGPLGFVRVVGIAETNNGDVHPDLDCDISGSLFRLRFVLTSNATYECTFLPVRFYWRDCDDNMLSGTYYSGPYISRRVFDTDGGFSPAFVRIDNLNDDFPTHAGYQSDQCPADISIHGSGQTPTVDFYNGGVQVICDGQLPNFGDLNFDNIAFTTADAVIFTNYLVYGWDAFNNLPEAITRDLIIRQSDINQDGLGLTLADLVLLIQIGRDQGTIPYSLNSHSETDATIKYDNNRLWVSAPCAAAHIVVFGEVEPTLLASNMTMLTGTDGQYTSILVFSWDPAHTFDGTFMILDGDVLALTMVDASGVQFAPTLVPTTWSLSQNYPNPFNPITTIEFTLPKRTHIDLEVFNVSGQRVGLTSGVFGPGEFQTTWDGSDHASGVDWYRLTADGFSQSRKMLLLK